MGRALYVYAILRAGTRLPRVPGHRLERIELGAVAAAAEPRAKAPAATERALREQYRVVARLHERVNAILPVRFGALVEREELERVAALRQRTLLDGLKKVRGRSQMTVRLLGSPPAPAPVPAVATGTAYLRARVEASRPVISPLAESIRRSVAGIVTAESIDPGRGSIELTINHLVANGRLARYRVRVEKALAAFDSSPPVVMSGPMPPFAFAPDLWDEA
jgi:hypothetical protein